MPWPAYLVRSPDHPATGTGYIRRSQFPAVLDRYHPRGQAWRYHQKWTTYAVSQKLSFKAVEQLAPQSDDDFWTTMSEAKQAGLSAPPTSLADIFLRVCRVRLPSITARSALYGASFGGWQAALQRGIIDGRCYHYDLRSAYRWAACQGLPETRTAFRTHDWTHPSAIYLVQIPHGLIPYQTTRDGAYTILTSEERDFFGLQSVRCRVAWGLAFRGSVNLVPTFADLDARFPHSAKRISRTFWGLWNTTAGPEQVSWKRGERSRTMKNPFYNPIWSAFITSRVKLRMAVFARAAVHIFVDSVIVREPLPTGDAIGDFRLMGEYDRLWIRAPGIYGVGEETLKHCGTKVLVMPLDRPRGFSVDSTRED